MKKLMLIVMSLLLCVSAFSGCSGGGNHKIDETPAPTAQSTQAPSQEPSENPTQAPDDGTIVINGYTVNDCTFDKENIKTIKNEQYISADTDIDSKVYLELLGMGITLGEKMMENYMTGSGKISPVIYDEGIVVLFITDKAISFIPQSDEEIDSLTEAEIEEINKNIDENTIPLCAVLRKPVNGSDQAGFEELRNMFTNSEELFEFDGAVYFFADTDVFDDFKTTGEERRQLSSYVKEFPFIRDNICVFRADEAMPTEEPQKFEGCLNDFEAKTMSGKDIDQSVFEKYDVTLVNVWTTWCGFCVMELPGLQELYEQLPENVNIISVCADASAEFEKAWSALENAGVKFETVIDNRNLNEVFCNYIDSYPTTVFVDKDGNIIGDTHIGVPTDPENTDALTQAYLDMIAEALKSIGK